ncbi:MAG: hypothetical protein QOI42_1674 [Frankiaceae bacterium]|jgi:hypothetical protein|nr:hypothetical protein [Frankiaceae bacterium]
MPTPTGEPPSAVFDDARGGGRALRVTWHPDAQLLVLSVWRDGVCIASHRMTADELPRLAHLVTDTMAIAYAEAPATAPA